MLHPLINARRLVLVGAALVSLLVLAPWASGAGQPAGAEVAAEAGALAPANDVFAAAQALSGELGDLAATTKDATKEAGEPAHAGNPGGASVWFRWTGTRTGRLTVLTRQIAFDSVIAVYTGTAVSGLTEVASNDDFGASKASRVSFPVAPGTEYFIAVDGFNGVNGPFALRWRQGPTNDDFVDAPLLDGVTGSVEGTNFGATSEPGEPIHDAGASVWYRWVAPEDGTFTVLLDNAPVVTVYSGASVDALTTLGSGTQVAFAVTAGTQYSIAVESNWNDEFGFELDWGKTPANDAFAAAEVLEGRSGAVTGTDAFATSELNEPETFGFNTVWYAWTAPRTEHVRFEIDAETLTHDPALSVWEGASVDALTLVEENDDFFGRASALSFEATAGTIYHVRVSGFCCDHMGAFDLDWYPGAIIFGSFRSNVINGTSGRDYIAGLSGHDVIRGGGGADVIEGHGGEDRLFGDGGNDTVRGGSGPDLLNGGSGNDLLISRDRVRGNDVIVGGSGRDSVQRDREDEVRQVP